MDRHGWTSLPRAELEMPALGLGAAPLGGLFAMVDDDSAARTIEHAWTAGIRYFDTAPLYGFGLSERRLGRALRSRERDDYVLSSKVGRLLRADAPPDPAQFHEGEAIYKAETGLNPVFDYSRDGVRRSIEESLERLGVDRIDIAYVHDPDDHIEEALGQALPALAELRDEGMVRGIGAGMNQTPALLRLVTEFECDVILCAGRYTLLDFEAHDELFPACLERGTAVVAGGVFNSGILADPRPGATFNYIPAPDELVARAQRIQEHCERHAVALTTAAVQFVAAHPAVTTVLVGARSPDEVEGAVGATQATIPDALWDDLTADGLLRSDLPQPKGHQHG